MKPTPTPTSGELAGQLAEALRPFARAFEQTMQEYRHWSGTPRTWADSAADDHPFLADCQLGKRAFKGLEKLGPWRRLTKALAAYNALPRPNGEVTVTEGMVEAAVERVRRALDWYRSEAAALAKDVPSKKTDAMLASLTVLSLDAGRRATDAMFDLDALIAALSHKDARDDPPEGHANQTGTWKQIVDQYGHLTRDQLMGGRRSDLEVAYDTAMLMRGQIDHEAMLHAARDRIRWLSVQLAKANTVDDAKIERAARAICIEEGCSPDALEPGNCPYGDNEEIVDGIQGGEPCHFAWRRYRNRARAGLIAARATP